MQACMRVCVCVCVFFYGNFCNLLRKLFFFFVRYSLLQLPSLLLIFVSTICFIFFFFCFLLLLLYLFSQSVSLYYSIILHLCRIKFVAYVHNKNYKWQSFDKVYSLRRLYAKVCVLFRMLCFTSAKYKSLSFSDGINNKYSSNRMVFFIQIGRQ